MFNRGGAGLLGNRPDDDRRHMGMRDMDNRGMMRNEMFQRNQMEMARGMDEMRMREMNMRQNMDQPLMGGMINTIANQLSMATNLIKDKLISPSAMMGGGMGRGMDRMGDMDRREMDRFDMDRRDMDRMRGGMGDRMRQDMDGRDSMDGRMGNQMRGNMSGSGAGGIPSIFDIQTSPVPARGLMGNTPGRNMPTPLLGPSEPKRARMGNQGPRRQNSPRGDRHGDNRRNSSGGRNDSRQGRQEAGWSKPRRDEEYDPSQPTEDDPMDTGSNAQAGQKRRAGGSRAVTTDMKVTIPNKKNDKGTGSFFCHVCNLNSENQRAFTLHMQSGYHKERVNQVMNVSRQNVGQQVARKQAADHLRKIENEKGEDFCNTCDHRFAGTFISHKNTKEHRRKQRLKTQGCRLCKVSDFQNYPEYVKHIDSADHKKTNVKLGRPHCELCNMVFKSPRKYVRHCNTANHQQKKAALQEELKKKGTTTKKVSGDDDASTEDMDTMVTVDATGIYEDEEPPATTEPPEAKSPENAIVSASASDSTVATADTSTPQQEVVEAAPQQSTEATPAQSEDESGVTEVPKPNVVEIPAYDPDVPLGQEYIIPVSGYFCKLCNKFYNNEFSAKWNHCKSKPHYEKFTNAEKTKLAKKGIEFVVGKPAKKESSSNGDSSMSIMITDVVSLSESVKMESQDGDSQTEQKQTEKVNGAEKEAAKPVSKAKPPARQRAKRGRRMK